MQEVALVSTASSRSHEEIESAGSKTMCIIFKGNTDQALNSLHHKRLIDEFDTAECLVKYETLPPIGSATKYHSFRTYFPIIQWMRESNLRAVDWDWAVKSNKFIPVLTDLEAAPQSILEIIRCQCKTDFLSRRIGCRKNNFPCTYSCGSFEKQTVETLKYL